MSTTTTTTTPDGFGFAASVVATPDTFPTIMAPTDGVDAALAATELPDAAQYANEVRAFISRFWSAPSSASLDFLVLWIVGTHLRGRNADPFLPESFPLLMLGSTEPESGKTTALKLVAELACRGKMDAATTAPSALNSVEGRKSTLCLDEFDTLIGAGAGSRDLRAHLLASYDTGGSVTKAAGKGETRDVDVHFPIAFAGLIRTFATHKLLAALRTRTIVLHCRPYAPGPDAEPIERYRQNRHRPQAVALREVLSAWGLAFAPDVQVTAEHITLPDGVHNRDGQLWEPLFALAQVLGGDWPDRCLAACLEITKGTPGDDAMPMSPVAWLMRDLTHVWTPGAERMSSADVVMGLLNLPDSPWMAWLEARPDAPAVSGGKHLAKLLAERNGVDGHPIRAKVMKIDKMSVRGFMLADLVAGGMTPPVVAEPPVVVDDPAPAARPKRKRNPSPRPAHGRPAAPVTGDA